MNQLFVALIAALMLLMGTPTYATSQGFSLQSDIRLSAPLFCAEKKDEKKDEEEEEEPDCD